MEQLVKRVINGDEKAFEELYKLTYKQVHFTCMAFLKNEQDVADATQDIYLIVLNSLHTLKDESKFESWLGRITINKCKDYLKKYKPVLMEEEALAEMLVEDDELLLPEEYVTNKAKRKLLMDIVRDNLSDVLFQTVILFYFHNMSAAEIAELMACPVGTVTSRLCLARARIKDAVLAYEKKSGDKLHAIALAPILALLFKEEAMAMEPEYQCDNILNSSSTKVTTAQVVKTGGKVMLKSLKVKLIAGVIALLVIVGGIVGVVAVNSEGADKENTPTTNTADKETNSSETTQTDSFVKEDVAPSVSEDIAASGTEEVIPEEVDYDTMAQSVATQIDEFFLALTTGDVDTLVEMSAVNEEGYEQLLEISEFECTPQFLRIMFGDVKHCINEETIADMAYDLKFAYEMDKEYMHVSMEYSKPIFFLMANMYPAAFADGTEIAEYPNLTNNEKAFAMLEQAMDVLPMMKAPDFWIQLPDENGEIKVVIDYVFDGLELDDLSRIDEIYPARFLDKHLKMTDDIIVGANGSSFYENNDVVIEIDKYLTAKDFKGLESYLSNLNGEDYASEYGQIYGTYEALTDTQKQFVDSFITEKFNYQMVDYVINNDGNARNGYRNGMMILTFPLLDDLEHRDIMLTDWYEENDVMEYTIGFPLTSTYTHYSEFIYRYYNVIDYATKYVE